jgi:hypothetical protein
MLFYSHCAASNVVARALFLKYRIKQAQAVTFAGAECKRQEMGAKCDQNSNFGHLGKL